MREIVRGILAPALTLGRNDAVETADEHRSELSSLRLPHQLCGCAILEKLGSLPLASAFICVHLRLN
jgi:hypothetical protein